MIQFYVFSSYGILFDYTYPFVKEAKVVYPGVYKWFKILLYWLTATLLFMVKETSFIKHGQIPH